MPKRIASMQAPETPLTFGARLRHERERRKISIASIAESTKILGALLEGLENDDVSRWPIGFYRRAFIRAYATSIGLDPDPVLREFTERFPEPEEAPPLPPPRVQARARLRLAVSQHASWFMGGQVLDLLPPRVSAVAFDIAVIGAVGVGLYVLVGALWAPLALAGLCYYSGGILVLGNTPGVCLFAPDPHQWKTDSSSPAPTAENRSKSIWNRIVGASSFRIAKSVATPGWSKSAAIRTSAASK